MIRLFKIAVLSCHRKIVGNEPPCIEGVMIFIEVNATE
jgi:hypothetical protein